MNTHFGMKDTVNNTYQYQKKLSCKHAYFVINETINYYGSLKHKIEIAQLDAEKAFDALWRVGLFHKLLNKIEPVFFRANYFSVSQIIVKYDGQHSDTLKTTDGCKQGGILSGYLFNFYMDELVNRCINLNIGCKIGNQNTSIIAYCDDVFLMATTKNL